MNQETAQKILRNIDKIKHLANGGKFGYLTHKDEWPWISDKMSLCNLDHYRIIPIKKPRYKVINAIVLEKIED